MSTWESHITVRAIQPVVAALEALGYDTEPLLAESAITRGTLTDPEGRVPHQAMMRLWKHASEATGDDHLGLHLAEAAPIRSFEVHAYAVLSSPSLRAAYRRACQYQRLIHEATNLVFEETAQEGILRHTLPGGLSAPRHPAEFLAVLWVRFGRLVTGEDWSPRLVCFAHEAPRDTDEHARIFRAPVHFSTGRTALFIPNEILDAPNPRPDLGLLGVLDRYAEEQLNRAPRGTTLSERVHAQLQSALRDGTPTAAEVAEVLHMSVRTLHRDLKDEGTSFQEVLDGLRHEQAVRLLVNPRTSITEVAFLLGFAEVSSFYRAFKRWTGKTPADVRAEALAASRGARR